MPHQRFQHFHLHFALVEDKPTMCLIRYFKNHVSYFVVFCAKPKEVDPIKLTFYTINKCINSTKIQN